MDREKWKEWSDKKNQLMRYVESLDVFDEAARVQIEKLIHFIQNQ